MSNNAQSEYQIPQDKFLRREMKLNNKSVDTTHRVWHQFHDWLIRTFGKDLYGEWQTMKIKKTGKTFRYRNYNEYELSKRLVGYEVMVKIERYVNRFCPEIKILKCDDDHHAGSFILLIPHPNHGITMLFIPQCTSVNNQMFLYSQHHSELMKAMKKMGSKVYNKKSL